MRFKTGDKVKCIDDSGAYELQVGHIYVVEGWDIRPTSNVAQLVLKGLELSYMPSRFVLADWKDLIVGETDD